VPVPLYRVVAQLAHDRSGVTAIEYAIITGIMVAVASAGAHTLGNSLTSFLTRLATELG
jgi:Flp pilus assembly pilin Flp